jgi:O-antigen/teichoic acid export membrane protein
MFQYIRKRYIRAQSLKTVGIYTFSNFFTKAISFASLPFFTYMLTQKDFGAISIFTASVSFFMPFVSLSILYSTSTDYFKLDDRRFASFISSTFPLPLIVAFLGGTIFMVFFPFFKEKLGFYPLFIWALPLVVYCNFLLEQNLTLFRNNNEPKRFLLLSISKIFIELGLALLLILGFHYDWKGRIWGILISFMFSGFFAINYLYRKKYLSGKFDPGIIKKELVYSLPAVVTQFSIFCLSSSDRYFVNYYYGGDRTGVYSVAATFASVILIFATSLLQYFFPKIYYELSQASSKAAIQKMFWKYTRLVLLVSAGILVLTPLAYFFLISKKFINGLSYFFLLTLGNMIWCITYFFYSFLMYHKAKRKILFASLSAIAVSLILNYFFIRNYGETGAAISGICVYTIVFFIIFFITKVFFTTKLNEKAG